LLTRKPRVRGRPTLRLFTGPECRSLAVFPHANPRFGFVLSADGLKLARQIDVRQVEVRNVHEGRATVVTRSGGYHTKVLSGASAQQLTIIAGKYCHWLGWDRGDLEHQLQVPTKFLQARPPDVQRVPAPYDPARFLTSLKS